jgi:hypothetical protein
VVSTRADSRRWATLPKAMLSGQRSMLTRNAWERTSARASAWATATILSTAITRHLRARRGRARRCARRGRAAKARHLEQLDRGARHQRLQERLGIAAQPHLLHIAVVDDPFDTGQTIERGAPAAGAQADGVGAVLRLDLGERAVEHLAAAEDHEQAIAQPLGRAHVVRREDDGGAAVAQRRTRGAAAAATSSPQGGAVAPSRRCRLPRNSRREFNVGPWRGTCSPRGHHAHATTGA